jgi:Kef-type K+ transport system membrane component KefB
LGRRRFLKEEFYQKTKLGEKEYPTVEAILSPIEGIFAPVFFVLMRLQVDVSTFADMNVLLTGLVITVVAIISKALAGVFVTKGNDKLIIGIGKIPRGEVGLIFPSIGKSLGVLDKHLFSVIIIFVLLTTLVTPPLLKWSIDRKVKSRALG